MQYWVIEECIKTWKELSLLENFKFGKSMLDSFFIHLSSVKNATDLVGLNVSKLFFYSRKKTHILETKFFIYKNWKEGWPEG